MIKVLSLLPVAPGKTDATRLCGQLQRVGLDTSLRSVQRDLVELSSIFPIRSDSGNPAGWSWVSSKSRVPFGGDPLAAALLLVADRTLAGTPQFLLQYIDLQRDIAKVTIRECGDPSLKAWLEAFVRLPTADL